MDGCLAAEVTADRGRNERRLLPIIGAVWAHETTLEVRRGVDGWSRLDSLGYWGEFEGNGRLTTAAYDGDYRGRELQQRLTLQGGVSATTMATGGASGA
ncbi:hypothetical protein V6N13_076197 [Hibiscus sabdariffa]|uniref:Uncharacterized protein n=2 Tax=Hibiscus sabdariffa TaxID=183260 RepID=A0ABR2CTX5_9ROSI